MNIKPIETIYNGYRFRSRLEARWAVFFDNAGIEYMYEPEGFEVNGYRYLPDFYFPESEIYGEVKGKTFTQYEKEKMAWCIDFNGPLNNGLVLLGNIPSKINIENMYDFCMPFVYWEKGIVEDVMLFSTNMNKKLKFYFGGLSNIYCSPLTAPCFPFENAEPILGYASHGDSVELDSHRTLVGLYMDKARQARFEHGDAG